MADQQYSLWEKALGLDKSEDENESDIVNPNLIRDPALREYLSQSGLDDVNAIKERFGEDFNVELLQTLTLEDLQNFNARTGLKAGEVTDEPPPTEELDTSATSTATQSLWEQRLNLEPLPEDFAPETATPSERSYAETFADIVGDSFDEMTTNVQMFDALFLGGDREDYRALAQSISEDFKNKTETPESLTRLNERLAEAGMAVHDADGFFETTGAIFDLIGTGIIAAIEDPEAFSYGVAQSAASSLPSIAGSILGGIGGGFFGGPGGALAGSATGTFIGTFATEGGAFAKQMLLEKAANGEVDIFNLTEDDIVLTLDSEEFRDHMRAQATKAGASVAIVDALFQRFGGQFMKLAKDKGVIAKTAANIGDTAFESIGESAGEGTKQVVTGGELDATEIFMEGYYGYGQSQVQSAIAGMAQLRKARAEQGPTDDTGGIGPTPIEDVPDGDLPMATEEQQQQAREDFGMDPLPGENPNIAEDGSLNTPVETVQTGDALDSQVNDAQQVPIEPTDALEQELVDEPETTEQPSQGDLFDDDQLLQEPEPTGVQDGDVTDEVVDEAAPESVQETTEPEPTAEVEGAAPAAAPEDTDAVLEPEVETEAADTAEAVKLGLKPIEHDGVADIYRVQPDDQVGVVLENLDGKVALENTGDGYVIKVDGEAVVDEMGVPETYSTVDDAMNDLDTEIQLHPEAERLDAEAQTFETDTDINYEAITEPPLSNAGRIQVGHFFERGDAGVGDQRFHVFVDNKVVRGKNGKPLVYKTLKGAEKRAEKIANEGLPALQTKEAKPEAKAPKRKSAKFAGEDMTATPSGVYEKRFGKDVEVMDYRTKDGYVIQRTGYAPGPGVDTAAETTKDGKPREYKSWTIFDSDGNPIFTLSSAAKVAEKLKQIRDADTQAAADTQAKEVPLNKIKVTRTVTKADGTTAEMTGNADTVVRQYQKKADAYISLLRCVNG